MNSQTAPEPQSSDSFEQAWSTAKALSKAFLENKSYYVESGSYQEAEARADFIDKFFVALGWDVSHDRQRDPYRQEVKIEKTHKRSSGRADYAFSLAPFFQRVRFFVEAKRPQHDILTPDNCFQTIRYGWPQKVPFCVLTDFNNIHILDTRFRPNISSAASRAVKSWNCRELSDRDKFAEIYWLLSREAVAEERADPELSSEYLTESVQRTLDRLIFMRFLEDKAIEDKPMVARFGTSKSHWQDWPAPGSVDSILS
jgi:adenine-specific DNA-methyltransferase